MLQIEEVFSELVTLSEENVNLQKHVASFIKRNLAIEEEYIQSKLKSIKTLTDYVDDESRTGSLCRNWSQILRVMKDFYITYMTSIEQQNQSYYLMTSSQADAALESTLKSVKSEVGKAIQDFRKLEEEESKSRAKYTKDWQNWIDFFKDDRKSNLFGKTEEAVHKKAVTSRDENIRLTDSYNFSRQNLFDDQFPSSVKSFTSINTTVSAQIEELGILTQCVSEVAKLFHLHYYENVCDAFKKLDQTASVEENLSNIVGRRFKIPKVKAFIEYIPNADSPPSNSNSQDELADDQTKLSRKDSHNENGYNLKNLIKKVGSTIKKKSGSNNGLNQSLPSFSLPASPVASTSNYHYINNSVTSSVMVSSVSGTQPPSMTVSGAGKDISSEIPLPQIPEIFKNQQTSLQRHVSDGAKPSKNPLISQLSTIDSESDTLSDLKAHLQLTQKLNMIKEGVANLNSTTGNAEPDDAIDFDAFDVSVPNPIMEEHDLVRELNETISSFYVVTAVFDYVGSEKEELSFKAGEKMKVYPEKSIKLEDDTVAWYWAEKETGPFGFIPSNYVEYEESTSRLVSMYEESVPEVVRKVCSYIEEKGLETENLFLHPKNPELVKSIKEQWNGKDHIDLRSITHPSDMAEILKDYFSRIKNGLIASYHMETIEKICGNKDTDSAIHDLQRKFIWKLPNRHFFTLKTLFDMLHKVQKKADRNSSHMDVLSKIFCPVLMPDLPDTHAKRIFELMLLHKTELFQECCQ